jgi:hypothetical protein
MADFPMNGRGYAPQAGSYQAYQGYQQPPAGPPAQSTNNSVRAAAALAGAGISLALLVGVGAWSYQLIARDVAGVPVVRAVQGEMRIRPAAGGTAGPSDRIVLAPEPIDLASEDTALIDQLAAAQPRFAPSDSNSDTLTLTAPVQEVATEADPKMASIEALAAQIAAGATPLTQQGQVQSTPVVTSISNVQPVAAPARAEPAPLVLSQDAIAASVPGVTISLRPKVRPDGVRTASLGAVATSASGTKEINPSTIPAGTRLVQLGAYESPEIARQEWERFSQRFVDYMAGKDRVVQKATSGGRTFYRLRAHGFSDLADARRFCSALTAQNTDCIPVVTR